LLLVGLTGLVPGGIRIPDTPRNVSDPSNAPGRWNPQFDGTLLAVSLEPHAGCLDVAGPLRLTVAVVNFSSGPIIVEWDDVLSHVSLTPVGPGRVSCRPAAPLRKRERVETRKSVVLEVDLKDWFELTGPSVYRLDYARPLPDGRVHVCDPVYFIVEDFADIDRWARDRWPKDPKIRERAVALLKANPLFAFGVKRLSWRDEFDSPTVPVPWAATLAAARKAWGLDESEWDMKKLPPTTVPALLNRSAALSGGFAVPFEGSDDSKGLPPVRALAARALHPHSTRLAPDERMEVAVELAAAKDRSLRELATMAIGSWTDGPDAARVLIRLADDPDSTVAAMAIASVGKYQKDPLVTRLLRRKLSSLDGQVSLAAALRLCFGDDAAGFPVLIRLTQHPDDSVRIQAIAMLGDNTVFEYDKAKAEAALLERLGIEKESRFIQQTLESLGSFQSDRVRIAILPFLTHHHPLVRSRAVHTLKQVEGK
jgi:hypothetical protein